MPAPSVAQIERIAALACEMHDKEGAHPGDVWTAMAIYLAGVARKNRMTRAAFLAECGRIFDAQPTR